MTRTVLVDDHKLFSEGLKKLLEDSKRFVVIQQFTKGDDLLNNLPELSADLLITDIEILGEINGLEITRRIRLKNDQIKIVVLSMHEESVYMREALQAKADAYLTKSIDSSILVQHLLKVINNEKIFSKLNIHAPTPEVSILSPQERKVLKFISEGKNSEQIAEQLSISKFTVKVHRRNMMKKLKVESSAELISICFNKGIL
jgi:DNA-binding NarL/FixJ family response regulator